MSSATTSWDVQRDHVELLIGLSRLLSREGEAIFSCNLRTFRPDIEELARAGVVLTDITAQTIPEDFSRNQRIHHCYLVRRYTSEEAMRMVGMDEGAIRERTLELRENAQRRPRSRAGVVLTDITAQTIPEDFSRNQRIHHCYLVRRYTSEEAMRMVGMDEGAIRERTLELRENAQRRPR